MTAPLELRAKQASVCAADREKACFRGTEALRGCPMFEFPGSMERNNYCNLCGQCVTACTHGNLALRVRALGQDLWAAKRRVLDESYLAIVLVGLTFLVTAQMLAAWPGWISGLARWLPGWVRAGVKPVTYLGAVESAVLLGGSLVVVPLLLLGAAVLADRLAGAHGLGVRRTFVVFGYMFVPVGLAMHLAHNLAHLLLEGGGIVPVVQRAAALYTPISLGSPDWDAAPLAPEPVVGLLQLARPRRLLPPLAPGRSPALASGVRRRRAGGGPRAGPDGGPGDALHPRGTRAPQPADGHAPRNVGPVGPKGD